MKFWRERQRRTFVDDISRIMQHIESGLSGWEEKCLKKSYGEQRHDRECAAGMSGRKLRSPPGRNAFRVGCR